MQWHRSNKYHYNLWYTLEEIYSNHEWHTDHFQPTCNAVEQTVRNVPHVLHRSYRFMDENSKIQVNESNSACRIRWRAGFWLFNFMWYMIKCFAPTLSIPSWKWTCPMPGPYAIIVTEIWNVTCIIGLRAMLIQLANQTCQRYRKIIMTSFLITILIESRIAIASTGFSFSKVYAAICYRNLSSNRLSIAFWGRQIPLLSAHFGNFSFLKLICYLNYIDFESAYHQMP